MPSTTGPQRYSSCREISLQKHQNRANRRLFLTLQSSFKTSNGLTRLSETMRRDEHSMRVPICRPRQGHHSRHYPFHGLCSNCFQSSSILDIVVRIVGIVLLPFFTSCGGIAVFIAGCLTKTSALIISGAVIFILGILFCLLCGHICDHSSTRSLKHDDESVPV